jgi:hypothetical protein
MKIENGIQTTGTIVLHSAERINADGSREWIKPPAPDARQIPNDDWRVIGAIKVTSGASAEDL